MALKPPRLPYHEAVTSICLNNVEGHLQRLVLVTFKMQFDYRSFGT